MVYPEVDMDIFNLLSFITIIIPIVYSPEPMTLFLMSNGMQNKFKETWIFYLVQIMHI